MTTLDKTYDFTEVEPRWQKYWEEQGIYRYDPDHPGESFSVDTPPPYVSAAHLHVGHAMSYAQAEFIVRYQRMLGKKIYYPMGFRRQRPSHRAFRREDLRHQQEQDDARRVPRALPRGDA